MRLRNAQADLRRQMETLEERIAVFQQRLEAGEPEKLPAIIHQPAPAAFSAISRKTIETPPPLPPAEEPAPPERPPAAPAENFELKVGKYWLVRIGILVLLTGLVLLGNLAYRTFIVPMGPAGKLTLLYLTGGLLLAGGWWLEKRVAQVRNYARVLMAGGAAAIYYTTYAAHFVAPLRVIESPWLSGLLLLALAGTFAWFAERRRSEGVAFIAVLLSYYTSAINPAENFTLFSNLLLAALAGFFLLRHRWFGVSWLSLAGSYLSFAYWRGIGPGEGEIWVTHGFLAAYWVIFTLVVFLRRAGAFDAGQRAAFLTANNAAFFVLAAPAMELRHPEVFWVFAVVFGGVLLALSALAFRLKPAQPIFDGAYLAQGLMVLALGIAAKFSGYQLGLILAFQSVALIFGGRRRQQVLCEAASVLSALAAFVLAFDRSAPHPWLAPALTALFLLSGARLWKGLHGSASRGEWLPAGFSLLALVLGGWAMREGFSGDALLYAFLVAAVVLTAGASWLGLPEVSLLASGYLAAALFCLVRENATWSQALPDLGAALFVMHWWKSRKSPGESLRLLLEAWAALAFCAGLFVWMAPNFHDEAAMPPLALAGLLVLIYGLATRSWFLAGFSQIFTLLAAALCLSRLALDGVSWQSPLAVIGSMAAQSVLTRWIPAAEREALTVPLVFYRGGILLLAVLWVFQILPESSHFFVFVFASGVVLIPAALRRNPEYLVHAGLLMLLALGVFWLHVAAGSAMAGYDFLALLLALVIQQMAKNLLAGTSWFPAGVRNFLVVVTLAGLWLRVSRWSWEADFPITIGWSLLAFALLGAGFLLRERAYRLTGLLVLAVAVGNVFFVEVWKMGQFAGILGIIGLALVLLALGFVYNRYASQIKRWL